MVDVPRGYGVPIEITLPSACTTATVVFTNTDVPVVAGVDEGVSPRRIEWRIEIAPAVGVSFTAWNGTQAHLESMVGELLGPGVTVTDVRFTGEPAALGYVQDAYFGGERDFDGIVLSTGQAQHAVAPGPRVPGLSTDFGRPGYQRLTDLVPPYATYNAAILEIDIQTARFMLGFDYLFASNEYPGFVGSQFDNVFGSWSQNTNCALLPEGRTVQVNSAVYIRAGSLGS